MLPGPAPRWLLPASLLALLVAVPGALAHETSATASGTTSFGGVTVSHVVLPSVPRVGDTVEVLLEAWDSESGGPRPVEGIAARPPVGEDAPLALRATGSSGRGGAFVPTVPGEWRLVVSFADGGPVAVPLTVHPERVHRLDLLLEREQVFFAGRSVAVPVAVLRANDSSPVDAPADAFALVERWEGDPASLAARTRVPLTMTEDGGLLLEHAFTVPGLHDVFFEAPSLGVERGDRPPVHVLVVAIAESGSGPEALRRETPGWGAPSVLALLGAAAVRSLADGRAERRVPASL